MALITLLQGEDVTVEPLNNNFTYLDGRITSVNTAVTSNTSNISSLLTSVQSLQTPTIKSLSGTTVSLTDNSEHAIRVTETTTFVLPVISDATKFHQMLVLLDMPTVQTINLGTDAFFNGESPDLSTAGTYTLIYEYNGVKWVVGALFKSAGV